MAPISADRLLEIIKSATDELDTSNEESNILPPSGELGIDSDNESDDGRDDHAHFEKEVPADNDSCRTWMVFEILMLFLFAHCRLKQLF